MSTDLTLKRSSNELRVKVPRIRDPDSGRSNVPFPTKDSRMQGLTDRLISNGTLRCPMFQKIDFRTVGQVETGAATQMTFRFLKAAGVERGNGSNRSRIVADVSPLSI